MLPFPAKTKDVSTVADWTEFLALAGEGISTGAGVLERELRRSGTFDSAVQAAERGEYEDSVEGDSATYRDSASISRYDGDEASEVFINEVFVELESRSTAAGDGYPFKIIGGNLRLQGPVEDFVPYVFCLCLSQFGDPTLVDVNDQVDDDSGNEGPTVEPTRPRRLFEHLSAMAAAGYIGGKSIRFGWPRKGLPKGFSDAVDTLCTLIGEGAGFQGLLLGAKDRKLDVVAWKDFPDKRAGKIMLWGQCATNKGNGWIAKLSELQPDVFQKQSFREIGISQAVKAFFMPHRISDDTTWEHHSKEGGIMFDRCRIARFAETKPAGCLTSTSDDMNDCRDWMLQHLENM